MKKKRRNQNTFTEQRHCFLRMVTDRVSLGTNAPRKKILTCIKKKPPNPPKTLFYNKFTYLKY